MRRIIIAILLLCTYCLSFAQGLLPHSHDWQEGIGNEHHHHHYQQDSEASSEAEQDFYELILGFLSDLEFPDEDLRAEYTSLSLKKSSSEQSLDIALFAVLLSFYFKPESRHSKVFEEQNEQVPISWVASNISERGPPFIS